MPCISGYELILCPGNFISKFISKVNLSLWLTLVSMNFGSGNVATCTAPALHTCRCKKKNSLSFKWPYLTPLLGKLKTTRLFYTLHVLHIIILYCKLLCKRWENSNILTNLDHSMSKHAHIINNTKLWHILSEKLNHTSQLTDNRPISHKVNWKMEQNMGSHEVKMSFQCFTFSWCCYHGYILTGKLIGKCDKSLVLKCVNNSTIMIKYSGTNFVSFGRLCLGTLFT